MTDTREGQFTRSDVTEVDEAEIFEGAENRLTMNQTYTWEFQCQYVLQRYPFDSQVTIIDSKEHFICLQFQECKIEMTVRDLEFGTVNLLAEQVGSYKIEKFHWVFFPTAII